VEALEVGAGFEVVAAADGVLEAGAAFSLLVEVAGAPYHSFTPW
jgi:hypothetical protein